MLSERLAKMIEGVRVLFKGAVVMPSLFVFIPLLEFILSQEEGGGKKEHIYKINEVII